MKSVTLEPWTTNKINSVTTMATAEYSESGNIHHLILTWNPIHNTSDPLVEVSRQKPVAMFPGNVAFVLTDTLVNQSAKAKVLMVFYDFDRVGIYPSRTWCADVVRNPSNNDIFVVLVYSCGQHDKLRVYKASSTKPVSDYPLEFNLCTYDKWPPAAKPIVEFDKPIWHESREYSGIAHVSAQMDGEQLLIKARQAKTNSLPILFHLDLSTKKWTVDAPPGIILTPQR